ncbi:MAG: hypothetical protein NZ853_02235 [Leptospiraceae bacterium]|nr:hypothetical protein [Leptospiraceae bacterium]MDW7975955.1 hypothetical protein [Leptospiraceae bacterium]
MEIYIITAFVIYVLYNEIHKRIIKNTQKEFTIPKTLYDNLKDTIQYVNYTLEAVKQKHENIHKVYLKILEVKQKIDEWEQQNQSKKRRKRQEVQEVIEEKPINPENQQIQNFSFHEDTKQEENKQQAFFERLIEESNQQDKIDFSFRKTTQFSHQNQQEMMELRNSKKSLFEKIGGFARRVLNLPEIPIPSPIPSKEEIQSNKQNEILTIEEYEKRHHIHNITNIHQKQKEINLSNSFEHAQIKEITQSEKKIVNQQPETKDPKEIIILEAKKLFSEKKQKDEQIKFIKKLLEIGFLEEEIQKITNFPISEIQLISKFKEKNR